MKFTAKQYATGLYQAFQEVGDKEADAIINSLIAILKNNGDLGLYEHIVSEFEKLDAQEKNITVGSVHIAHGNSLQKEVLEDLNKLISSKIEATVLQDANIVGGLVLRTDNILIDASLKEKLNKLEKGMIN